MKALILNSGIGSRMGDITKIHPKCMTKISENETIISRQLRLLSDLGIKEVVMTTGLFDDKLKDYCIGLNLPIKFQFVKNPRFNTTNYIYSIYCARELLNDDIIFMHGDLVFTKEVLKKIFNNSESCMAVSTTIELPEKDFKAVIKNGKIQDIGIEFFNNAVAAQPLYKIEKKDWRVWLNQICKYCEHDKLNCYAENAFNDVSQLCNIIGLDIKDQLCMEIDNQEDLKKLIKKYKSIEKGEENNE